MYIYFRTGCRHLENIEEQPCVMSSPSLYWSQQLVRRPWSIFFCFFFAVRPHLKVVIIVLILDALLNVVDSCQGDTKLSHHFWQLQSCTLVRPGRACSHPQSIVSWLWHFRWKRWSQWLKQQLYKIGAATGIAAELLYLPRNSENVLKSFIVSSSVSAISCTWDWLISWTLISWRTCTTDGTWSRKGRKRNQ